MSLGLCLTRYCILPISPLALAFLYLREYILCALSFSMIGSSARKLMSLR